MAYEIIKEDIKQKKLYFYENYQEYIESCFYFQSFYLLQYEEIVKRIHKQIWEYEKSFKAYKTSVDYNKIYNINSSLLNTINASQISTFNFKENDDSFDYLYFSCFAVQSSICYDVPDIAFVHYYALASPITSDNLDYYNTINIPMYDNIALMKIPIYIDLYTTSFISFNGYTIFLKAFELCNNSFNKTKLNVIYNTIHNQELKKFNEVAKYAILDRPPLVDYMFGKIIKEIEDIREYYKGKGILLVNIASGYFSEIDYGNNKFYSMNNIMDLFAYIYIETDLIDNYLYFINNKLSSFIDITFIPLYYENNTIYQRIYVFYFYLNKLIFKWMKKEEKNYL